MLTLFFYFVDMTNSNKILVGFIACILILFAVGTISYKNNQQFIESDHMINHTYEAMFGFERLLLTSVDAETGERGFIITGDNMYLAPFYTSKIKIQGYIEQMRKQTSDNPVQQKNIADIEGSVNQLFTLLSTCIEARQQGGFDAAKKIVDKGNGKRLLDEIRAKIENAKAEEYRLLSLRQQRAETDRKTFDFLFIALLLVCTLFMIIYYWVTSRNIAALEKAEAHLSERNTKLEENIRMLAQSETALKNKENTLQYTNRQLENTNKELSSFAYVSSHDLQEPLRKILTFSAMIAEREKSNLSPKGVEQVQKIHESAGRMKNLIQDILTYATTNNKNDVYEKTDFNILLSEVIKELEVPIQEKRAKINTSDLPVLNVIPFQLRQLFTNLVSNSIKFARKDVPLVIQVSAEKVNNFPGSTIHLPSGYWLIRFSDNGIGFDSQYSKRIFEIFQRLHDKNSYSGTGIGLAICKKIVENHNGFISASGQPDLGAVFDIYLPA